MTPEYRTIQRNTSDINDAISNKSNPSLFADKLVDNDFISNQAANSIVQVPAFSNYNKVSQLMQAVDAQIRTASNPVTTFETFIKILRELSLDQLADKLVKFYRELKPGYKGHLCSQGGDGPAPGSTSSQQKSTIMELNLRNILNVLHKADFADAHWERLGQQLKIRQPRLATIAANRFGQADNCMVDTVTQWLNTDTEASWERLAEAVAIVQGYGKVNADTIRREAGIGGQKSKANEDTDAPENKKQRLEEGRQTTSEDESVQVTEKTKLDEGPAPQGRIVPDSGSPKPQEKPLFDNEYWEEILSKHRPVQCTNSVEFQTIEDFAQKVEIVIQSCNRNEYCASLEMMEAPQIPKPDGRSQLFEKAVRFPNKIDMKIALGMFAGHKAAIAWTEQGASCERDIRKVLGWFPNTKALLGVGVAYGMKRDAVKFCDVLVASQIADFGSQPRAQDGGLHARGEFPDTKPTLKNIFCKGDTLWNFPCTAEKRSAKVVVGQLVSGPFLLDDPKIKQSIQEQCKFAKGGEMEGWVLYNHILKDHPNLEAIIIKGVADYADGEKDKQWQLTAAMAAASYTHFQLEQSSAFRAVTSPQSSSLEEKQDTEKTAGVKSTKPSETLQSSGQITDTQTLEQSARDYTPERVGEFLEEIGLGDHVASFTEEEIDGDMLLVATDDTLQALGVQSATEKLKIKILFQRRLQGGVVQYSLQTVLDFLKEYKLDKYCPIFQKWGMDGDLLLKADDNVLIEMGVMNPIHRTKIIAKYKIFIKK